MELVLSERSTRTTLCHLDFWQEQRADVEGTCSLASVLLHCTLFLCDHVLTLWRTAVLANVLFLAWGLFPLHDRARDCSR